MKKGLLVLAVLALLMGFSAATSAGQMPAASLNAGELALELEYGYSRAIFNYGDGAYYYDAETIKFDSNRVSLRPSVGITDRIEVFGEISLIDAKTENAFFNFNTGECNIGARDSARIAVGGGLKATLVRSGNFQFGLTTYARKYGNYSDENLSTISVEMYGYDPSLPEFGTVSVVPISITQGFETSNHWECGVVMGPSYRFGNFTTYLGLQAIWRQLDVKQKIETSIVGRPGSGSGAEWTTTTRQNEILGLVVGCLLDVSCFRIFLEGNLTNGISPSWAGGIGIRF